jgi:hypothetical protein
VHRCDAGIGEFCRNTDTGAELARSPAHPERMREAGVVFEPVTAHELKGLPPMRTAEAEDAKWQAGRTEVEAHRRRLAARAKEMPEQRDSVDPYADDNVLWLRGPQRP